MASRVTCRDGAPLPVLPVVMEAAEDRAPIYFALSVHAVLMTQRKWKPACRECTVCGSLHSGRTSVTELGEKCLCKSQNSKYKVILFCPMCPLVKANRALIVLVGLLSQRLW